MLTLTTDTVPPFLEIVEVLGMAEVTTPIHTTSGLAGLFRKEKNGHDEAIANLIYHARSFRSQSDERPNLLYGIRVATTTVMQTNGPVVMMTYIGTVAVCRNVGDAE